MESDLANVTEAHLKAIRAASGLDLAPFWCAGSVKPQKDIAICSPEATPVLVMRFPSADMQPLIQLCEPATFGKDKQNVLDPNYRRALALSTEKFYTSFDLAAYDILHTIKTAIMPDVSSVRAELYKLNVYRPGDFFKAHVDTPRGDGMFGSLVVCLPQTHTGGNLVVRHGYAEHAFNFATKSADTVQWAAFYSDCEHEIKPVESGYRVTLTYNLYVPPEDDEDDCKAALHMPGLSFENLELYNVLGKSLAYADFLPRGGKLVWRTQHYYPHTTEAFTAKIESMLKGTDALTFKALQQLGLDVNIQAWHHCSGKGSDYYSSEEDEEGGEEAHLTHLMGMQEEEFHEGDTCQYNHTRVFWITRGGKKLEQTATMRYGNEYSISLEYSTAVIVAEVPPANERSTTRAAMLD